MLRSTLFTAFVVLTGCGMGTELAQTDSTASNEDALYRTQLQEVPLTDLALRRSQRCYEEIVRPNLVATVREMVQLRTREVALDLGEVIQSSYVNTTGENEEIRKGIAEFSVTGDVQRAELRFSEARGVWPYNVGADTHGVSIYSADFKATIDDFEDPATEVVRFETDVNMPPRPQVTADITRAVQQRQPAVGFRFALENIPGYGTQFDNVELVVTRCRNTVEEIR
jgi:hypothetical protein